MEFHQNASHELANDQRTEVLRIPAADFAARNHSDDIWIDGALYDIGHYEVDGDFVNVTVYRDQDEETFVSLLAAGFESNNSVDNGHSNNQVSKHKVHVPDCGKILPTAWQCRPFYLQISNTITRQYGTHPTANVPTSVIKPPPRFVAC
jgi:hypothetical protein